MTSKAAQSLTHKVHHLDLYTVDVELPPMTKEIKAVFEQGIFRPLEPLDLPEGTRLNLIIVSHEEDKGDRNAAKILAEIAALPLEG